MKLIQFIKRHLNYYYLGWVLLIVMLYIRDGYNSGLLIIGTLVGIISGLVIMAVPFLLTRIARLTSPLNHILYGSFFLGALICLISLTIPPTPEQFFRDTIQLPVPESSHDIHYSFNHSHGYTKSVLKFNANPEDIQKIVKTKCLITLKENMDREFKVKGRISITIESPDSIHLLLDAPQTSSFTARNYFIEPYWSDKQNNDIRSWYNLSELDKPEIYVPLIPCEEILMNSSRSNSAYLIYNKLTNTAYYFSRN